MVQVIKSFYKLSDKKTYNTGDKTSFSKEDEKRLEKEGLVKIIVKNKK